MEYLEAEFFLRGSLGHGLDKFAPNLTFGGPKPMGARKANLDPFMREIIKQFGLQHLGHLRVINKIVKGFPRLLLDLSAESFAEVINMAFGRPLSPPFDPYATGLNFLIASYFIPYVGLTGFVGANPKLQASLSKKIVAGLLAVEVGQDAVIRAFLNERAMEKVEPYGTTVGEFTGRLSELRNKLGHAGLKDKGLQIGEFLYGGGDEHVPGGFFPWTNGRIARFRMHLHCDA
ncbi:desiccation-related protein PCC13-62-like [Hevea brasiliensis]|uniref:desiccation-related protein PCC13-62-like n=1 Tax=Hevea brasiliensis TaxID=3981 RepID=UPI0025D66867|nr:desiccation-related protein PCC13-62-like [Hevea brasiliensis]